MDPNVIRIANAVSNVCKVLGTLLVAKGVFTQDSHFIFWLEFISGSAMVIVPAIYDLVEAVQNMLKAQAVGVQAGINLTLAGQTVDHNGKPISSFSPDATPPKPVTIESAAQIVADHGVPAADIPKS